MTATLALREKATLHLVDTPFAGHGRSTRAIEPGTSIAEALSRHWPEHWPEGMLLDVSRDGQVVEDLWTEVRPGEVWSVMPRHGDPITVGIAIAGFLTGTVGLGAAIATIAAVVITAGIYYGLSKLLAPSIDSLSGPEGDGSSTYRWDGMRTDYSPLGGPVPVVYGQRPIGGRVISYFVRSRRGAGGGLRGELWIAVAVSEGPIAGIGGVTREVSNATGSDIPSEMWVNGNRVQDVPGVRVWTRLGRIDQAPVPGFNDQVLEYPVGRLLRRGVTPVVYSTRNSVHGVELGIGFPKGLMSLDASGTVQYSDPIEFRYRTRLQGTTTWSDYETFRIRERQPGEFVKFVPVDFTAQGRYEIEVERTTPQHNGLSTPDRSLLEAVNEVIERDFTYPGTAAAFFVFTANSVVSGGRPQFEIEAKGRLVRIWNGVSTTDPVFVPTWTRSPFWVAFDILTNTDYSIGDELRHAVYLLDEWQDGDTDAESLVYADVETTVEAASASGQTFVYVTSSDGFTEGDSVYLDKGNAGEELIVIAEIPGSGPRRFRAQGLLTNSHLPGVTVELYHARYEVDAVFDRTQSPWSAANDILATARSQLAKVGNLIRVIRGTTRTPVLLLTEGNLDGDEPFELTRLMPRNQQPNQLVLQYPNRNNRHEIEPLPVSAEDANIAQGADAAYWTREAFRSKDESTPYITRTAQVKRHGRYRLRALRLPQWRAKGVTSLEALQATLGDVVEVAHPTILAVVSGQVAAAQSSGTSAITLDREITILGGTTYEIRVRIGDEAWQTRTVTTGAGTYAAGTSISVSGTWSDDVAKGAPYVFGVADAIVLPMELMAFTRRTDHRIAWEAIEYVEVVYADV